MDFLDFFLDDRETTIVLKLNWLLDHNKLLENIQQPPTRGNKMDPVHRDLFECNQYQEVFRYRPTVCNS